MGTREKLVQRFKGFPTDFTFEELERLLGYFDYCRSNKGRTSGSRVIFKDSAGHTIMLHRPHPDNKLKTYAMKQVYNELTRLELL